jgi:hypothetical protein
VIHDAVLHLQNEQPLLVDIFEMPSPSDTVLVCSAAARSATLIGGRQPPVHSPPEGARLSNR